MAVSELGSKLVLVVLLATSLACSRSIFAQAFSSSDSLRNHGYLASGCVVPATLTDFKIPPPTFLTVPIKNEIPVKVDTTWQHQ